MFSLFFRSVEVDLDGDEDAMRKLQELKEEGRVRQDFLPLKIFLEDGEVLDTLGEHEHLWTEALPGKGL